MAEEGKVAPHISLQSPADSFLGIPSNHVSLPVKAGEGLLINSCPSKSDANTLPSAGPRKSSYQISKIQLDLQVSSEI